MRSKGFTLVELMVGLAVGMFVALVAISVFVSTRTLQSVSSSETRMNENARLALDILHQDLRSAGFQGCHQRVADPVVSLLVPSNGLFLDASTGLGGAHGNGTSFTPALNAILAAVVPPPDPNSDVLAVRVPVEPLSLGLSTPMTSSSGVPQVGGSTAGNTFLSGDIALLANCKTAVMFQVTDASPQTTGALTHAVGGAFNPSNATADLGTVFRGDSAVYRMQTRHYYVAPSVARPGTNSLWRYTFPPPGAVAPAQEIVAGIDRMVVTFGVDNNALAERAVNRYLTADALTTAQWDDVVASRIQLLTATVRDGVTLKPQAASFAGGTVTGTDRRMRTQVTEVVTLRSRAP
jgi:type IV pilus assembly protein PilW